LAVCLQGIVPVWAADANQEAVPRVWEFVQSGGSGSFDGTILTLQDASPSTIGFTERPDRIVRAVPTQRFVDELWASGSDSFAQDPPNAVLVVEQDGTLSDAVIEISKAHYDGTTISYEARVLSGHVPASFDAAHMVIDAFVTML
jgi:hypothetical protein